MNITLMCRNSICNHKEEYKENLHFCPVCKDEMVKIILDKDEAEKYD